MQIQTPSSPFNAGLFGWPVAHSLSPRLHRYWLEQYGIDGAYTAVPFEAHQLPQALQGIGYNRWRGANLTVPHKEAAVPLMQRLDPDAARIGAVNLVVRHDDGALEGRNTDAYGFRESLRAAGFQPRGGVAVLLGAGGAARAVLAALSEMGFETIRVANRNRDRAAALTAHFATPRCAIAAVDWADRAAALDGADLLVNATSLGMHGQPALALALDRLPGAASVCDIVYAPLETVLLRDARARGHRTIDGLGMLLHQARPSFRAFFGTDPVVTDALRRHMLAGQG